MQTHPSRLAKCSSITVTCPRGHTREIYPDRDLYTRNIVFHNCEQCRPEAHELVYDCPDCDEPYQLVFEHN